MREQCDPFSLRAGDVGDGVELCFWSGIMLFDAEVCFLIASQKKMGLLHQESRWLRLRLLAFGWWLLALGFG